MRRILILVLISLGSVAAQAQSAPCLLEADELAPVFGVKFDAGVIEKDARGTASCSYAVVGGGSARVVIRVEDRMDAGRFARLRKSRAVITGKDLMVDGVSDAAFSNEGMFAALQASRTVEISGFRTAAKRKATLVEDGQLLRVALGRASNRADVLQQVVLPLDHPCGGGMA